VEWSRDPSVCLDWFLLSPVRSPSLHVRISAMLDSLAAIFPLLFAVSDQVRVFLAFRPVSCRLNDLLKLHSQGFLAGSAR
jgi:hypothetical protein